MYGASTLLRTVCSVTYGQSASLSSIYDRYDGPPLARYPRTAQDAKPMSLSAACRHVRRSRAHASELTTLFAALPVILSPLDLVFYAAGRQAIHRAMAVATLVLLTWIVLGLICLAVGARRRSRSRRLLAALVRSEGISSQNRATLLTAAVLEGYADNWRWTSGPNHDFDPAVYLVYRHLNYDENRSLAFNDTTKPMLPLLGPSFLATHPCQVDPDELLRSLVILEEHRDQAYLLANRWTTLPNIFFLDAAVATASIISSLSDLAAGVELATEFVDRHVQQRRQEVRSISSNPVSPAPLSPNAGITTSNTCQDLAASVITAVRRLLDR